MAKLPDYEERSQAVLDRVAEIEKAALESKQAAQAEIFKDLPTSIKELRALRRDDNPFIRIKAIREHCLLAGLYTEKHEHTGPNGTPLGVVVLPALKEEGAR